MPDHFVETNIVIGYTVEWDRQWPTVQRYFDAASEGTLYTSPRVLTEAEDVVNERRRLAKQAARRIFREFEAAQRGRQPIDQIVDFVYGEFSHCRNSVVDHVIQHIEDNPGYYIGLTQVDTRRVLESTTEDIDDDFAVPIDVIDDLRRQRCADLDCSVFTDILEDYSDYAVFVSVDSLSCGRMDKYILMDAFHLSQTEGIDPLHFVTMDGHFLDNESYLERRLGCIDIEHPDDVTQR